MPHVIVKLWPGKTEQQKKDLTTRITAAVTETLHYGDDSVSVAMEEIESGDWRERVYQSDIQAKWDLLTKKPGYRM